MRSRIYIRYIFTAVLGLVASAVFFSENLQFYHFSLQKKLNSARLPASEQDELDGQTQLQAERINNYFLPYTLLSDDMITFAVDHITPGAEHNYTGEKHEGDPNKYIKMNSSNVQQTYCLESVNDAAIEAGFYGEENRVRSGIACLAGSYFERAPLNYTNLMTHDDWRDLIKKPEMAPRGAILVYRGENNSCEDKDQKQGHIEIKTSPSGRHTSDYEDFGYVSISAENRPAFGYSNTQRVLVGVYVQMPTEMDFLTVYERTDVLLRDNINFTGDRLGYGRDIQLGSLSTSKRKKCLLEARAVLYYTKRAYNTLSERDDYSGLWGDRTLDNVRNDIDKAHNKLRWRQNTYGDDRNWGIDACTTSPGDHGRLRYIFPIIKRKLEHFPVEDEKENILELMREIIGTDSDSSLVKPYYNAIRANRYLRD